MQPPRPDGSPASSSFRRCTPVRSWATSASSAIPTGTRSSSRSGSRSTRATSPREPLDLVNVGARCQKRCMTRRLRGGVGYGGRVGEHEVSLRSAATVIGAFDPARYEVVPIAITKDGRWLTGPDSLRLLEEAQRTLAPVTEHGVEVMLPPVPSGGALVPAAGGVAASSLDVVFPVLHGTYGEDGTMQGLLELAGLPYVGAGVLASAVGMDKAVMKGVFPDARIPGAWWIVLRPGVAAADEMLSRVNAAFGVPCFVKPCNLGSSVGITKVKRPNELAAAIAEAAAYDPRVIVEEAIDAREFECGVLGNE